MLENIVLNLSGSLTIIAPTKLWQKRALNSSIFLVKIMKYRLLQDEVSSDNIANDMLVPTLANMAVRFNTYNKLVGILLMFF